MKRFWIFSAIIFALYSCTESTELDTPEAEDEQLELDGGYAITATISMSQSDDESETRISSDFGGNNSDDTWVFTWDIGDSVQMIIDTDDDSVTLDGNDISEGASTAEFTGSMYSEPNYYSILYTTDSVVWSNDTDDSSTTTPAETITLDLSQSQTGELNNLVMISELYNFSEATTTTDEDGNTSYSINPYLYHVCSFMDLEITFKNIPEYWRNVTVESISCSGLNTKGTITLSEITADGVGDDFYSNLSDSEIKIEPINMIVQDTTTTLHLNILPTTMKNGEKITTTLCFSNGIEYEITKTFNLDESVDVEFERATFSTNVVECDLLYETRADILGEDTTDETSTDSDIVVTSKKLRYIFDNYTFNIDALTGEYIDDNTEKSLGISTKKHMYALAAFTNAGRTTGGEYKFTLKNDIDLENSASDLWTPIGYCSPYSGYKIKVPFEGTFDGAGHTISNYYAYAASDETVFISLGLFGYIEAAYDTTYDAEGNIIYTKIKNYTTIKDFIIDGSTCIMDRPGSHAGILTGTLECGAIIINCGCETGCSVTMNARGAVGGLVGSIDHDSHGETVYVYNCYNRASVHGEDTYIGTTTSSTMNIGGLCGRTLASDNSGAGTSIDGVSGFRSCYSSAKVTADNSTNNATVQIGLLAGLIYKEDIFVNLYYDSSISNMYTYEAVYNNVIESNGTSGMCHWYGIDSYNVMTGGTSSETFYNYEDNTLSATNLVGALNNAAADVYDKVTELLENDYHDSNDVLNVSTWGQGLDGYPRLTFITYDPNTTYDYSSGNDEVESASNGGGSY